MLPVFLNLLGVDFSYYLPVADLDYISTLNNIDRQNQLHYLLGGRFIHILITSASIGIALLTVILAFVDYAIKRDISTPIVGVALFCAGLLDVFHVLSSTRIIQIPDSAGVTSFTWIIARAFHALVLILSVSIFPVLYKDIKEDERHKNRFVYTISIIFILLTLLAIQLVWFTPYIPQMLFPGRFIPGPYDFALFMLYLFIATAIFPKFYRLNPSFFSQTLLLSLIPAMAAHLHIAFGSHELFDNDFFIAHYLKLLSYFIPFIGLSLNYLQTHKNELRINRMLNMEIQERKQADATIHSVINSSLSSIQVYKSVRDKDKNIIDFKCTLANQATEKLMGGAQLGHYMLEEYPDYKEQGYFDQYVNMVETGEPLNFEQYLAQFHKWFHTVAVKLGDGFAVTSIDISERKEAEEKLRESQHFIQQIADATPNILYVYDLLRNKNLYRNRNIFQLLGYPESYSTDEVKQMDSLIHPDDRPHVIRHFKDLSVGGGDHIAEIEHRLKDANGNWRWFYTRDAVFKRDKKGKPLQLIGTSQDITERKSAVVTIAKSEAMLAEAQKMAHLGSLEWDQSTDVVIWSDELFRILGYAPGEIAVFADTYGKHVHPDDQEKVNALILRAIASSDPFSIEHKLRTKSGEERIILLRGRVLREENGQWKMLSSIMDITDQKKAADKVLRNEELYRAMARNMPDSVVVLFDKNLIINLADGNAEVFNLQKNRMIGQDVRKIFREPAYNFLIEPFQKAIAGDEATLEMEIEDKYFNIEILPVRDNDGEIFAGLCVFHNITELKRYQQALEFRIEELNRSNTDLEQFAYVASHDLQEPLRKIQAFGDRLASKYQNIIDQDGQLYIERMQHASARMQVLIDDLLAFSRLSRNREPYIKTDLNRILQDVLKDLEISIESSGATIHVDKLPVIQVIPRQIQQLFQNLISNAVKFTKPDQKPEVHIFSKQIRGRDAEKGARLIPEEKYCNIYIRDNGIGFDEKYLERIFVIFQRLHGRNEFEGTGIGLAICKKIVENHFGAITAHSIPGEGATFVVTLPLKQQNDEAEKVEKGGQYTYS